MSLGVHRHCSAVYDQELYSKAHSKKVLGVTTCVVTSQWLGIMISGGIYCAAVPLDRNAGVAQIVMNVDIHSPGLIRQVAERQKLASLAANARSDNRNGR